MTRCFRLFPGAAPALAAGLLTAAGGPPAEPPAVLTPPPVGPIPAALREARHLPAFYQKSIDLAGFPILGSGKVSDAAMREAAWILQHVLAERPELLQVMATHGARLAVMAYNEYTTDLPEQADMTPKVFWDRRARGLGGSLVSCAEENLLGFPGDPYSTENILIHEFGHAIHGVGLRAADPWFNARLEEAYRRAKAAGKWKGTYAGENAEEYWAEAVQDWFDNNRENDALHNHVNTRAELKAYDPDLAALCAEVFGNRPWRYQKPAQRDAAGRAHLAGFDAAQAPRFRWRFAPIPARPRVLFQTELGEFELELDAQRAPITVSNFLFYVHEGFYQDGVFHRTVTLANQPTNQVKIEVIQGSGNPAKTNEFPAPIVLERTRDTGLRHRDGTVSMARTVPDSAQDHFFICVGDQPELDHSGARNPDGQGFAAFGQVIRGMEVIRRIHTAPADGQQLNPPIRIQRAIRRR